MKLDLELVDLIMNGARVEIWRSTKEELIKIANELVLHNACVSIWKCETKWEVSDHSRFCNGNITSKYKRKTVREYYKGCFPVRYCLSVSPPSEDRFISEKVWP